jgi:hypothetical protein
MVVKTHAGDLDSFDRRFPRRRLHPRVAFANQLPVNPAGKIQLLGSEFGVRWQSEATTALWIRVHANLFLTFLVETENPKRRRRFALPAHSIRKKINVKRINC